MVSTGSQCLEATLGDSNSGIPTLEPVYVDVTIPWVSGLVVRGGREGQGGPEFSTAEGTHCEAAFSMYVASRSSAFSSSRRMKTLASVWPWSSSSSTRRRPRGAESNTWNLSLQAGARKACVGLGLGPHSHLCERGH